MIIQKVQTTLLTISLLTIDLITKYFFYNKDIGRWLSFFKPILNTGISRWINANHTIVIAISIIAMILFFYLLKTKYISWFLFSLLIAGTLGNLIDRIIIWWVRDFISIWDFPVFNAADIMLNIWIIIILAKELWLFKRIWSNTRNNSSWNRQKKN